MKIQVTNPNYYRYFKNAAVYIKKQTSCIHNFVEQKICGKSYQTWIGQIYNPRKVLNLILKEAEWALGLASI